MRSEDDWCQCVNPQAKVLTEDLRWVAAGELTRGDRLLAFDGGVRRSSSYRHLYRRWQPAMVLSTGIEILPRYRISLSSSEILYSTPEHRWVVIEGQYCKDRWVRTDQLRVGYHLPQYVQPWGAMQDRDTGWLAGFFDGEGCLVLDQGQRHQDVTGIVAIQNPGPTLEEARRILLQLEFAFDSRRTTSPGQVSKTEQIRIKGGFPEHLRFLGQVRPIRLLDKLVSAGFGQAFKANRIVRIESIERIDNGPMVTLQSSTETYLVEGFAAHNTYILDGQFERLYQECKHLFPRWWREALRMPSIPRRR